MWQLIRVKRDDIDILNVKTGSNIVKRRQKELYRGSDGGSHDAAMLKRIQEVLISPERTYRSEIDLEIKSRK